MHKQLEEVAADLDYTPGEFLIQRLKEDVETVSQWVEFWRKTGKYPPVFGTMDPHEWRALITSEIKDLEKRELAILDYFHPKRKAIEHKGNAEGGAFSFILEGLDDD